jgi:hypothetical protein
MKGDIDGKIETAKRHRLKMAQNVRNSLHKAQSSKSEEAAESGMEGFAGSMFTYW